MKIFVGALALIVVGAGVSVFFAGHTLRKSLPIIEGKTILTGLEATVTVERDALGVPTITGETTIDTVRTLGFLHAQERFFQMDLQRRQAAGELAELFGAGAAPMDREVRVHRFRSRAHDIVMNTHGPDRALLEAYSDGVNAGLAALDSPPFEYLLTGNEPAPWKPEDTVLTDYAMYMVLQDREADFESMLGVMYDVLPKSLAEFLTPRGTGYDAPVHDELLQKPRMPGPEVYNLKKQSLFALDHSTGGRRVRRNEFFAGSNNWAVAGRHTSHGGAILANDMHLSHGVPNIWYRVSIVRADAQGKSRRITGISLPGVPAMVAGSNGDIAWGFTNSYGDWSDLVVLDPVSGDEESYETPDGSRRFEQFRETIHVKDGNDEIIDIQETIWGPVIDTDHKGRKRVLRWVAHDPEGANIRLRDLEEASSIEEAFNIAAKSGIPAQNFVVADKRGNIGWTIIGPIPRRFGHDGRLPSSWADGSRGWNGLLSPEEYPRILNPPHGRIWTANARVVSGQMLAVVGDGGYALGARARQIRDGLLALSKSEETDMLDVQLDNRALFLDRWQKLMFLAITRKAMSADPRLGKLKTQVAKWGKRAATNSVGYRVVRDFRDVLFEQVFDAITQPCKRADDRFDFSRVGRQADDVLYQLVKKRPAHLLNPVFKNWDEQVLSSVDTVLDRLLEQGVDLSKRTWGERNTSSIRHPLSPFIPLVGRWLDMPATKLPGDRDMPRVQSPDFGASERMAVSPGREEYGYFHMPAGQSGHPLSPYYGAGHRAWENGEPMPFLPGPAKYTLTLSPE
ncbi:MAG: penicillin acylase family protein [Deltaproteobacteria bacterium]|nr:penicillin acylase family protein [Deltaproteobacteria bacterium]